MKYRYLKIKESEVFLPEESASYEDVLLAYLNSLEYAHVAKTRKYFVFVGVIDNAHQTMLCIFNEDEFADNVAVYFRESCIYQEVKEMFFNKETTWSLGDKYDLSGFRRYELKIFPERVESLALNDPDYFWKKTTLVLPIKNKDGVIVNLFNYTPNESNLSVRPHCSISVKVNDIVSGKECFQDMACQENFSIWDIFLAFIAKKDILVIDKVGNKFSDGLTPEYEFITNVLIDETPCQVTCQWKLNYKKE